MDNSQAPTLVNSPAMYHTANNFLSFADLSESHKFDSSAIDTIEEPDDLFMAPFFDQSWREVFRTNVDCPDTSPSMSSGSPFNPVTPLRDLEPEPEEIIKAVLKEEKGKRKFKLSEDEVEPTVKQAPRTLIYPPCYVCGGKASGDHYGVNSCEACKGFFRRYLLRKKGAYECKNGGQCEVVYTKRGMCAGCRLKKCLELGMSKDKCKLGRYSAEKRTEKIRTVKELKEGISLHDDVFVGVKPTLDNDTDSDIISKTLAGLSISSDMEETFSDDLIPVLIKAKNKMLPFGTTIDANNPEDVKRAIRAYHEEFQLKVRLYGELKAVSKEDFMKLYQTYGIDVDNRLDDLKKGVADIGSEVFEMCNFARHVPFFSKLSIKDQSSLLKVGTMEMYTILLCHGYDPELNICLDRNRAYHVSEMDKVFSSEFIEECMKCLLRCQKLNLNETEQVLVMAMSMFFTDRCPLENPRLCEKIQFSLSQMLKRQLEKTVFGTARTRFTRIIEYLTDARKAADMYTTEMVKICEDEVYGTEVPIFKDFILKE